MVSFQCHTLAVPLELIPRLPGPAHSPLLQLALDFVMAAELGSIMAKEEEMQVAPVTGNESENTGGVPAARWDLKKPRIGMR